MFPLFFPYLHIFIVIIALVIAWYALVIKPQRIMQKQIAKLQAALCEGAIITTNTGIQGTIITIMTNAIIIRTVDGELIEILPWSITSLP